MRKLLIGLLAVQLTACGTLSEIPCPSNMQSCRVEKPRRLDNFYMEAIQRSNKCEKCIDIENNCYHGLPPQCRPQWQGYR